MSISFTTFLLCGLFALLTAGIATSADAACLSVRITANGEPVHFLDKEAHKAEKNAITAWERSAANRAGEAFARWKNARQKKVDCWLPNRSYTQCKASGIPCDGR